MPANPFDFDSQPPSRRSGPPPLPRKRRSRELEEDPEEQGMREQETDSQEARRQLRRISALLIVLVLLGVAGVAIGCGVLYYYNVHLPHSRAVDSELRFESALFHQLQSCMDSNKIDRQLGHGYPFSREFYDSQVETLKASHDRLRQLGAKPPQRVIPPYE